MKCPGCELITRDVRPDSRKRVSLGAAVEGLSENVSFNIYRDPKDGTILLEPRVSVPASEAWLFENKTALESVKRGLRELSRGETKAIGSFADYADDES